MIYFVTARDVGRVKIGHAINPARRLINLQIGSPVPLALERVCDGGEGEEAALHDRFAAWRTIGEWFALVPEIEALMETLPHPARKPKKRERTMLNGQHRGDPATALLYAEIKAFCEAKNISGSTFGELAMGDKPFVKQLRDGRNVQMRTADRVRAFMASYEAEARAA